MNIHEYQAKQLLSQYGIAVSDFNIVCTEEEVRKLIADLNLTQAVLKVQIHAGGRGKAGGVKIARSKEQILAYAKELIGLKIVNKQTGPQGVIARQVMLTPLVNVSRELYLSVVLDRQKAQAVMIASPHGGMDIEEVAEKHPDKILKLPITENGKIRAYNMIRLLKFMGWKDHFAEQGKRLAQALAQIFFDTDATLIEINPLVETVEGELIALDAKISIDDNAVFRQPEIAAFYDASQLPKEEDQAKRFDLAYVALDGSIGCMVNGAGLAMATMDIIHHCGGTPANFLDVGGSATKEKVAEGFKIILSDPKVKAILVNIFGGIMNCGTLAEGIVAAVGELQLKVPLVVRMEGTNVEAGKKILAQSKLNITIASSLKDAAEKVVAEAKT